MKSTDFEIHNRPKLDKILVELCQLVIDGQEKDSEKIKYCINNGYSIIHIYQPEVWKNTYDWKEALKSAIFDLSLSPTTNREGIFTISDLSICSRVRVPVGSKSGSNSHAR